MNPIWITKWLKWFSKTKTNEIPRYAAILSRSLKSYIFQSSHLRNVLELSNCIDLHISIWQILCKEKINHLSSRKQGGKTPGACGMRVQIYAHRELAEHLWFWKILAIKQHTTRSQEMCCHLILNSHSTTEVACSPARKALRKQFYILVPLNYF